MNISFDLDITLIPNGKEFATEKRTRIAKFFGIEEIRKGTCDLILMLLFLSWQTRNGSEK